MNVQPVLFLNSHDILFFSKFLFYFLLDCITINNKLHKQLMTYHERTDRNLVQWACFETEHFQSWLSGKKLVLTLLHITHNVLTFITISQNQSYLSFTISLFGNAHLFSVSLNHVMLGLGWPWAEQCRATLYSPDLVTTLLTGSSWGGTTTWESVISICTKNILTRIGNHDVIG